MPLTSKVIPLLKNKKSFLAHIHLSPDPDAVGSVLALKLALETQGKVVHVFGEDPVIDSARFLSETDNVELTSITKALTHPHDVYLCLDTAKWSLATHHAKNRVSAPLVVIDHHPENSIDSKAKWVDSKASSTSLMIYKLLKELKWEINEHIATCLLYGLMGDTGLFQHTNTTVEDLAVAKELVELGANYHQVVLNLARSYTPADISCVSKASANLKLSKDGTFAWMSIGHNECDGLSGEPKLGFIANQFAGRITGTNFGAVLVEKERGITKGSLRSRIPEFDVSVIARRLGGGGHKNAASFRLEVPLEEAEKKFLKAVNFILKST